MREIYLVGEDEVTKAIIRKIMAVYTPELTVKGELPARGSEIKNKYADIGYAKAGRKGRTERNAVTAESFLLSDAQPGITVVKG